MVFSAIQENDAQNVSKNIDVAVNCSDFILI